MGVVIVLSSFTTAAFFMWGIGAFNPKYSEHGEAHEENEEDEAAHSLEDILDEQAPNTILGFSLWQVTYWSIITVIVLAVAAVIGPTLRTVNSDAAFVGSAGAVPMELFGQEIMVNQVFIFLGFAIWTLASLAVVGALIGVVFMYLSRGVKEAEAEAKGEVAPADAPALPAPDAAESAKLGPMMRTAAFITGVVVFGVLYNLLLNILMIPIIGDNAIAVVLALVIAFFGAIAIMRRFGHYLRPPIADLIVGLVLLVFLHVLFYGVLIGLVIGFSPMTHVISFVNALLVTVLILRPRWVGLLVGIPARFALKLMRRDGHKDPTRKITKESSS
jgi:hypothetical protein